jgi:hypothetical protein
MKRCFFNIFSALLLLLCVAMAVLWVRSYWVQIMWSYRGESGGTYFVRSNDGCIEVMDTKGITALPRTGFHEFPADDSSNVFRWAYLGFDVHLQDPTTATGLLWFDIPDWFICSVTAVLPYLWYRSYRRRRVAGRKGLCPKCGYDLRASKDRCPECGTVVTDQEEKA